MVANGTISGVVTSGPASTALIEGVDQCGHAIARSVTPFDGRFSFVGLLPGTYRITVDGRAPVDVGLYPGEMTVNADAVIAVAHVRGPDIDPRSRCRVSECQDTVGGSRA